MYRACLFALFHTSCAVTGNGMERALEQSATAAFENTVNSGFSSYTIPSLVVSLGALGAYKVYKAVAKSHSDVEECVVQDSSKTTIGCKKVNQDLIENSEM